MKEKSEKIRLEKIADNSWYNKGVNRKTIEYSYSVFKNFFVEGSLLELGPAEGVMTELLIKHFTPYTVIEGSRNFCDNLKLRYPEIHIINSLFEEAKINRKFDNIILGHVLEHVENPVKILKKYSRYLTDKDRILAAVPNAFSLHRQAAVIMGLQKSEYSLNETDRHHGHRRIYDPYSFQQDFLAANLKIEKLGGYWIKPLSNKQIETHWSDDMVDAFMKLGEKYVDISAEIYIIAKL